jgi:methylmalonyl-CoA/ethylmalonyl-CoA epimerase
MIAATGVGVRRLHHLGILAADLAAALPFYRGVLGLDGGEPHDAPEHDIRAVLLGGVGGAIELFAPLSADGPVARTLAKRGPGLHHVCYEVADIDAALAHCRAHGIRLIDEAARPGLHAGWRVAFLHPSACGGVLTELVEIAGSRADEE